MARLYLAPLDLNQNEIQNFRIQQLASDPGSPVTGQMYYNTGDDKVYVYNGSTWDDITTAGASEEEVEDFVGGMVTGNTETGITVTYEDGDGTLDFVVDSLDSLPVPVGNLDLNSNKIVNLSTPTSANDAANKSYVDGVANGLSWKNAVVAASTADGTLATAYEDGDTLDGVTLATGDRILLKDQSAGAENGIYTVNASGAPTRAEDADTEAELLGAAVFIQEGTTNADTAYVLTTDSAIVVDTTALTFAQFGAGTAYTAGAGLDLTANDFSVNVDDSTIEISTDTLQVKDSGITDAKLASTFAKAYSADVGNGADTSIAVTHSLGTRDVVVSVHDNTTPYSEVYPEIQKTDTNTVTLEFASAPTSNQYRVTVMAAV